MPVADEYDEIAARENDRRKPKTTPAKSESERLRPLTIGELRALKAPRWLIRLIVQRRAIVLCWGATQSGKTFIVFDMVASVARAARWFGRRVSGGGVIYVAGEGHLRHRVEAYMQAHKLTDEDMVGLRVVASTLNLLLPGADLLPLLEQLKLAAAEMGGVALVVLDTLNAMMPGGDENSSEDMGTMIAAARLIAEQLDCAVIFVHHCGKDEGNGARGHSSLRAAVDTELVVRDNGEHRTLTVEKQRDGETGIAFAFKLRPVDLGASEDPDADPDERESSCVVEPLEGAAAAPLRKVPRRDIALDALREAIAEHGEKLAATSNVPGGVKGVRLERWQARFRLLSGDDYKTDDVAASAFRRARGKLLTSRSVACSGVWAWLV